MEKQNEGGLPAPDAQAATGTENESMSISDYAASLKPKAAEPEVKADVVEETEATPEVEAEAEAPETAEGEQAPDNEQSEEQPETEDDKVLSQLTPKTLEKFQKRTDQLTAQKKSAEERALAAEARIKELEAKASGPQPAPEPELIAAGSDPSDMTSTATTTAALDKLDRDARAILTTYEDHEDAITRAIARDEPTVTIDGQEIAVAQMRSMRKAAQKHIEQHIPAKRKFLAERAQLVTVAKQEFPGLFDSRTREYQDLQAIKRQYPMLNGLPGLENWIGFALEGMAAREARKAAAAKPAAKPASATPPQSAADSKETAAVKPRAQSGGSDVAKLKADLVKAEKEMDRTGSKEAYQKVLQIQSRLKSLK